MRRSWDIGPADRRFLCDTQGMRLKASRLSPSSEIATYSNRPAPAAQLMNTEDRDGLTRAFSLTRFPLHLNEGGSLQGLNFPSDKETSLAVKFAVIRRGKRFAEYRSHAGSNGDCNGDVGSKPALQRPMACGVHRARTVYRYTSDSLWAEAGSVMRT